MARVTLLGMSGTGKSYYAGSLLESVVPEFTFAVHFDPEDEEIGLSTDENGEIPLYLSLEVDQEKYRRLDFLKVLWNHRKIRVIPDGLTNEEMRDLFGIICHAMMVLCREFDPTGTVLDGENLTGFISCDEAHNVIPNGSIDERVERYITGGRKHGAEILTISQRPQLLHKTCISQADRRIYFAIHEKRDRDKINAQSSFDAAILSGLESRRAIVENKDTGEHVEINTNEVRRERPHFAGDDGIVDEALPV